MNISDFNEPNEHPFGMLSGYTNASEKEQILTYILSECVKVGDFISVKTKYEHPTMVEDGLLIEDDGKYKLTKKSIGLLYTVFGKD